jgi:uncharacterized protein YuzE
MKLHYYPETDSLYIELRDEPGSETREIIEGLNVDLNDKGQVVGFDMAQFAICMRIWLSSCGR